MSTPSMERIAAMTLEELQRAHNSLYAAYGALEQRHHDLLYKDGREERAREKRLQELERLRYQNLQQFYADGIIRDQVADIRDLCSHIAALKRPITQGKLDKLQELANDANSRLNAALRRHSDNAGKQ